MNTLGLFLILVGKNFNTKYDVRCRLWVDGLYQTEEIPLKTCEGSDILLYFQANELASHNLMGTGRKRKTKAF